MKLIVAPLPAVEALLAARRPSHLITLASPGSAPTAFVAAHRLDLRFNDIAAPQPGLTAPRMADVDALLAFAQGWAEHWRDTEQPLLIHCWAGVSRSTAAAYVIACARSGPGAERDWVEKTWAERLRGAAPFATPNPLIVALADQRLGRQGAMIRAVAALGRGADTDWGRPFDLDLSHQGAFRP